jgi:hypothetical protein
MRCYFIVRVEDTDRTHNVNMHSHHCTAKNKKQAISMTRRSRPEFLGRKVTGVIKVYEY